MSKTSIAMIVGGAVVVGFLALWLTDVDVVDGGELPSVSMDVDGDLGELPEVKVEGGELPEVDDVDVEADAGELPEIDVDFAEVEIGSKEVDVSVPDVDVDLKKTNIKLPTIDVKPADAEGDAKEASPELNEGEGESDGPDN